MKHQAVISHLQVYLGKSKKETNQQKQNQLLLFQPNQIYLGKQNQRKMKRNQPYSHHLVNQTHLLKIQVYSANLQLQVLLEEQLHQD